MPDVNEIDDKDLKDAWAQACFIEDAVEALGLTRGQAPRLKSLAAQMGLAALPRWGSPPYTRQEFIEVYENAISLTEVRDRLGLSSTRSLKEKAQALGLKEKVAGAVSGFSQEVFVAAWREQPHLEAVADALGVSRSRTSLSMLSQVAQSLGLEPKERVIYTTPEGEHAGAIIGDWIDWHQSQFGISPVDTHVDMASGKVRALIKAGYDSKAIKMGLFQWTRALAHGAASPDIIRTAAHAYHLQSNPQHLASLKRLEEMDQVALPQAHEAKKALALPVVERKQW